MSGWNEDNFLEEIMPLLQQKRAPDPCPNADTVCAVVEGGVSATVRHTVAAHTAQCPACASLLERLRSFDEKGSALKEAEWSQSEKRLDNWFESFLASDTTVLAAGLHVRQSGLRLQWQRLKEPLAAVKIRWLLLPAAALALVIVSFLAGRVSVQSMPQLIADAVPPKEAVTDATARPTAIGELPSQGKPILESQAAPRVRPTPTQPNRVLSSESQSATSTDSPAPFRQTETTTETAAVTPPASTTLDPARPIAASAPIEPPSPGAQEDRAIQTAKTPGSAKSSVPGRTVNRESVRALAFEVRRAEAPRPDGSGSVLRNEDIVKMAKAGLDDAIIVAKIGSSRCQFDTSVDAMLQLEQTGVSAPVLKAMVGASAPVVKTEQPSPIPAPVEVRLDAGTRVWISLKSVRQRTAGVSEFSGALLLPVTQAGAMVLDRNTQISGIISVKQGKTTVQIMEFGLNGVRYRLRGTDGEANTVRFDAGKVLETWIVSTSIFGKLPVEVRPNLSRAVAASAGPASGQKAPRPAATPAAKPPQQ
jgi:hypothetical protein